MDWLKKIAVLSILLGTALWGWTQNDLAILKRAEEKATGLAKLEVLNRIGEYYLEQKAFEQVLETGTEVLTLADQYRKQVPLGTSEGNKALRQLEQQRIKARLLIGQFHLATDDEGQAVRYFRKAYRKADEISDASLKAKAEALLKKMDRGTGLQINAGKVLQTAVEELEALIPAEEREGISDEAPSVVLAEDLAKRAEANGNYTSALEYYEGMITYYEGKGDTAQLLPLYAKAGNLQEILGNEEQANWYRGLVAHMRNPSEEAPELASTASARPPAKDLSEIIEEQSSNRPKTEEEVQIVEARDGYLRDAARLAEEGDFEGSYEVMLQAQLLQKKIFDMEQHWREDSLETAFLIESKNQEIANFKAQQELRESQRNLALLGLMAILVITGLITYLLFSKRRAHRQLTHAYTDLNQTHEQLKTTQTQLVAAEKMASLGQLTAGIAHEINNPVNFISGNVYPLRTDIDDLMELVDAYRQKVKEQGLNQEFAELAEKEEELDLTFLREEIQDLLTGIEEGAHRTTEIVSGLRNFARLDNEEYKRFDVHQGLDSTLALLKSHLENIEVLKDYGDLPGVECFPGKLNQVFMNVLTNAIQAMPEGGMIYLGTENLGDDIEIRMRDTGMGMNEETLKRIFEPFYTTKDVGEGTGLGMSIVHGIIRQHHGEIRAESDPGQGTDVIIRIPINQPKEAAAGS